MNPVLIHCESVCCILGSQSNSVTDLPSVLNLLRQTMLHLESQLGGCLLHPQWTAHFRSQWVQALNKCNKTKDMVTALQVLESVMKPCVFVPAWSESLGHTFLRRSTQNEREEKKKQDKKERRGIAGFMALYSGVTEDGEDVSDRSLWCKYTLGLRHQVWKQKGEEFRITGGCVFVLNLLRIEFLCLFNKNILSLLYWSL